MEMSFFGMPLYILDICPENRDESNENSIVKLWLQFIPIFGALHYQLRKGHTTKKDIPMFHAKKDTSMPNNQLISKSSKETKCGEEYGDVFFLSCPLTGGLSVPRKSRHTCNAGLTIIPYGARCPDLPGLALHYL